MGSATIHVGGELYISLEAIADIYEVQVSWLREAYEEGLFGSGVAKETRICIAAVQLDRVSTVVRLHQRLGLDLAVIEAKLLGADD